MKRRVQINRIYNRLYRIVGRYYVIYGGRRSGKSVGVSQLLVRRALECERHILVLRKYATTIRLSTWRRMLAAIEEFIPLKLCTVRYTTKEIHFPNGSTVDFAGLDDKEKLKSTEGMTDIWFEEANEFSEEDFDTVDAGLSTPCDPPPALWITFNPIPLVANSLHWLQRKFLGVEHGLGEAVISGDAVVLRTWYKDNAKCPEPTVKLLESYKESNPELYRMWALGEFTELKGAILKNWDIVAKVPPYARFVGYGLDWGFGEDPAALVAVWRSGSEIWAEELFYASEMTNPDISQTMQELGLRKGVDDIVADNAEPKSIKELSDMGWVVYACDKSGKSYKRDGALYLKGHTIHVVEPSPDLIKEAGTWSWKLNKDGQVLPLVADGNDHTIDAILYRVFLPGQAIKDRELEGLREQVINPEPIATAAQSAVYVEPL